MGKFYDSPHSTMISFEDVQNLLSEGMQTQHAAMEAKAFYSLDDWTTWVNAITNYYRMIGHEDLELMKEQCSQLQAMIEKAYEIIIDYVYEEWQECMIEAADLLTHDKDVLAGMLQFLMMHQ
jgi:hypothetical protein